MKDEGGRMKYRAPRQLNRSVFRDCYGAEAAIMKMLLLLLLVHYQFVQPPSSRRTRNDG